MEEKTEIEQIMERNREASLNDADKELLEAFASAMKKRKAAMATVNAEQRKQDQEDSELLTAFAKGQKRRNQIALNISANENMQITIGNEKGSLIDHYVGDVASVATFGFVFLLAILHICGVL